MEDIYKKFIQAWENGVTGKELCKQFNICKKYRLKPDQIVFADKKT